MRLTSVRRSRKEDLTEFLDLYKARLPGLTRKRITVFEKTLPELKGNKTQQSITYLANTQSPWSNRTKRGR